MWKRPLKTIFYAGFYVLAAVVLGACIYYPVDTKTFVRDEKVTEIIDRDRGSVNIAEGSDTGLTAGNGRISGLKSDKYYMIEEWDENAVDDDPPISIQFVTKNGSRSENLTEIGRVTGGTITGLTNSRYYRVKAAKALPNNDKVPYYDVEAIPPLPAAKSGDAKINNGELTLPSPSNGYYLNLPVISAAISDMVKIPLPGGSAMPITAVSGNIIALEGEGTETDYVFVERDGEGEIIPQLFFTLKVTVQRQVNVKLTVTFDTDKGINLSVGSTTISKASLEDGNKLDLVVDTSGITETVSNTGFIVGGETVTGNTLTIKYGGTPDVDMLLVKGNLDVTVIVEINGKWYSKVFTVTIN